MATTKIPARDFTIEIDTAYPGTPAFIAIGGLNSLTPSPSTNRADTTDFDSNGVAEHLVMERGLEFTIAGTTSKTPSPATATRARPRSRRSPGRSASPPRGPSGSRARAATSTRFLASAEVTTAGGGHNDPAAWSAKLTVSGAVTHA